MAWGPFKSQADVDAERRVKLAQGKMAIKEYLKHIQSASVRYRDMAKKALALDQRHQAMQYAAIHLQYENQGKRWQSFQLKLADIELRGSALKAMGDLVGGLDGLVKSINKGLSLPAMEKTMVELQTGMIKVDQVESQMASHMENMAVNVGPESLSTTDAEVPEELKAEAERVCASLLDEVAVDSRAGLKSGAPAKAVEPALSTEAEDRMARQLERMRKLRPDGGKK